MDQTDDGLSSQERPVSRRFRTMRFIFILTAVILPLFFNTLWFVPPYDFLAVREASFFLFLFLVIYPLELSLLGRLGWNLSWRTSISISLALFPIVIVWMFLGAMLSDALSVITEEFWLWLHVEPQALCDKYCEGISALVLFGSTLLIIQRQRVWSVAVREFCQTIALFALMIFFLG